MGDPGNDGPRQTLPHGNTSVHRKEVLTILSLTTTMSVSRRAIVVTSSLLALLGSSYFVSSHGLETTKRCTPQAWLRAEDLYPNSMSKGTCHI